jgi:hypothetical protein
MVLARASAGILPRTLSIPSDTIVLVAAQGRQHTTTGSIPRELKVAGLFDSLFFKAGTKVTACHEPASQPEFV